MLHVRLFGELDVRLGDERLPAPESARARSLLGYLVLHRDAPVSRQRLAYLLWPDSTEGQARTNLRNLLHIVRRAAPELDGALDVTPRTLQWCPPGPCRVDVAEFSAALAEAEGAEPGSDAAVAALRRAVDLYAGDLLEGCYDEWLVDERERLRDRYVSALRHLAGALADRGEHAEAVRVGRELVRGDPLNEDAYRLLMRAHDGAGDRAGAVRVYHECAATLQRELGVEPSPATRDAYAALTRSDAGDDGRSRVTGAVLVGRDAEWDRLTRCWREAEDGRPRLVVLTGEPGVGKTRLVEELAAWCAHRGAAVAQARAYPTEGELGYGMVTSWLRAADMAAELRRAAPADLVELARLLPELGGDGPPRAGAADEAEQRRRLFDAVARTVATAERPTLLVADDAHWSDAQSLQLVHYLVRLDPARPLLVVATARREDLDERHPLTGVAGGLSAIDRAAEIALDRLTKADTAALARQLTGTDVDDERADALYADTRGNPLFVVETVRAGWDGAAITPKLQAVIGARLAQLSEPARHLVGLAATVGRAFTGELVGAAAGLDEVDLVRALDELWRRGVIREHDTQAYDFGHGKIRDVAYEALSPALRRRNHLLLAEALLRLHAGDPDAVSGQVAAHYDGAGRADEAITWYGRAAVQAQRRYANAEAVRLLQRADELVAALPADRRPGREHEVLTALPTPLASVEGWASDRLADVQRRALEVAAALEVDPPPALLRSLVLSNLCRDDFAGAVAVAGRLHDAALLTGDEGLRVESEYLLGIGAFWGGSFDEAQGHFEQVVDRLSADQRAEHLVRFGQDAEVVCVSRLANTLYFLGRPDEARRTRAGALDLAERRGHPFSRSVARIFAALLAIDLGEAELVRELAAALAAERDQAHPNAVKTQAMVGLAEVLDGRPAGGIARIHTAFEVCGPVNPAPGFRAALMRVLVAAHDAAGDPAGGLAAADEALALGGTRVWEPAIRRLRARFAAG